MPDRIISTDSPVKIDSVAATEEQKIATEPGQSISNIHNSSNVPGHADVDADDALSALAQKDPHAYLKRFQEAELDQHFLAGTLLSDKNKHASALTRKVELRNENGKFILHSLLGADDSQKGYRWYYSLHDPDTNNATFRFVYAQKPPRKELTAEERELLPAKTQELLNLTPEAIKKLPAKRQSEVQQTLSQVRPRMQTLDADQRKELSDVVQSALIPLESPPIFSLGADKGSCMMLSCEWLLMMTAAMPGTAADRAKNLKTLGREIALLQKIYSSYGDNDGRNNEVPGTRDETTRAMLSKNLDNKRQQHKNENEGLWRQD